jgi:4-aminobutyrate aminotransferase-like enzyme
VSEKQPTSLGGSASPSCEHRYCNTIEEASAMYADEIRHIVANYGGKIAAFITESIVGCGGQIELPPGYLAQCYEAVRSVGGTTITIMT